MLCRWLEVGVANLTCMQYWVTYLRMLQHAVWPGGNLPVRPRPQRTQQQKDDTKQQSLQCLMNLLPGWIPFHLLFVHKIDLLICTNFVIKPVYLPWCFPWVLSYSLFFSMCGMCGGDYAILYVYRSRFRYTRLRQIQAFLAGRSRLSPRFYHKQVGLGTQTYTKWILHCVIALYHAHTQALHSVSLCNWKYIKTLTKRAFILT